MAHAISDSLWVYFLTEKMVLSAWGAGVVASIFKVIIPGIWYKRFFHDDGDWKRGTSKSIFCSIQRFFSVAAELAPWPHDCALLKNGKLMCLFFPFLFKNSTTRSRIPLILGKIYGSLICNSIFLENLNFRETKIFSNTWVFTKWGGLEKRRKAVKRMCES